ncbi:CRISPR-associated endonuclease Cas2 [Candidatus Saccharibacteria bacterium]|nr:CRISPR-associated endonuclease Cas2 [Candidatus Saccharibacteria bacterium]
MSFRFMRSIIVFDLPVKTKPERRQATQFRKALLDDGFEMLQYSVYTRICNNRDNADVHLNRVKKFAPKNGSIRMITVTENQYADMAVISGEKSVAEKKISAEQLTLF